MPDARLAGLDLDATQPYEGDDSGPPAESRAGMRIGRFIALATIGSGGAGVVLSAYDPELDRKVAIKLLRPEVGAADAEDRSRRLEHEARAMARLNHPNVVTVYEVGRVDGHAFLAMELVEGTTLRGWQGARPRTWRELLAVYLDAAR